MSRKDREETVAVLSRRIADSKGMIVVDYTGLNVEMITGLRSQIRQAGSEFKVAKNTLLKIASKGTECEPLNEFFTGQTAVTFIDGDPAMAAKILTRFLKENRKLNPDHPFRIKAGVLESQVLGEEDINQLGNLPSKEVLIGQFVGLLAAPLTGFVSVLSDIRRKFLRVLSAVAEQKKQSS